jgi:hypothetical protein
MIYRHCFSTVLDFSIRKVQEIQVELYLNETHQLLVYVDYENLFADNINKTKKSTETLTDDSEEVGLEVNTGETKYTCMLLSRHQNAGQSHEIKIAKRCFENVT